MPPTPPTPTTLPNKIKNSTSSDCSSCLAVADLSGARVGFAGLGGLGAASPAKGDAQPVITSGQLPMEGVLDYRGRQISSRSAYGGWTSALYTIGVEITERFAYYGISSNLITYLTGPLGESIASAAANVNAWNGVSSMLPLLGGFLADSYIGRYRTIVGASLLYVLGLGLLTLSAAAPSLRPSKCASGHTSNPKDCLPTQFQVGFFFFSVYLVAFAHGGHKPCVQAFGADQFDENDPEECKAKSSFFNWWYFGLCGGTAFTLLFMSYVQDNIGWGLGFGLPCVSMLIAFIVFLMGTRTYRYHVLTGEMHHDIDVETIESPLLEAARQSKPVESCRSSSVREQENEEYKLETLRGLRRLFPIWATCLVYAIVFAQPSTFFTKQGSTMDRRVGPTFLVPPAALQSFVCGSVLAFIPVYDRVLVPLVRMFTGVPTGVTMLQRIGIGMLLSVASMMIAALVEMRRLQTARDFGLVDLPTAVVPMSLWWLLPQYVLFGISDAFTMVGLQEFFYDQVPDGLRSLGLSLYLSIFGIGSFISSFLVSVIDRVSRRSGESWFSDNLNRAHLDYFYWLLAGLSAVELVIYVSLKSSITKGRRMLHCEENCSAFI